MPIYVQFSDSTEATVITYFAGQQPPAIYANLGTVNPGDARWATFYNAMSLVMQVGLPAPTAT